MAIGSFRPGPWVTLLALLLGPGLVATLLWSPVLVVRRFRALFGRLPPAGSVIASYLLVAVGLSVPWVAGALLAFRSIGEGARPSGEPLLDAVVPLTAAYLLGGPLVAGGVLPRLGVDWDPTGYGPGTWALLVVAAGWYAAVFAVPLFVFALVVSLPT